MIKIHGNPEFIPIVRPGRQIIEVKGEMYFSPKGTETKPKNQQELLDAIICILEALVDVTGFPNKPGNHLTREDHAPEVFNPNHHGEVDVWSVEELILDASKWMIILSQKIIKFGNHLQSNKRPSAKKALKIIKRIKRRFHNISLETMCVSGCFFISLSKMQYS
ncbi:hypothetical protein C1645_817366 [Glomus cerebriforme]|uniref:Uncharacterized protein n=1 Tax=Glomus cerebriforme TaxID=658196 RepID=A0A397TEV8_9GLOM|nr:hypothetical protein C1645_817366 [Glomus cerebriforme]